MIKKGDLVKFYTGNPGWQKEYQDRNPGIVVASQKPTRNHYDKGHAYVLWADGSMTREHLSYLQCTQSSESIKKFKLAE